MLVRLSRAFPSISWFTVEHFGECPIPVINKFLVELLRLENEERSQLSMPIALAADAICRMKGSKKSEVILFNPFLRKELIWSAREEISTELADLILELVGENRLPQWAQQEVNMETVMLAATQKN